MAAALPLLLLASASHGQCRLCSPSEATQTSESARPLNIDIEASLDLGRAAGNGRGGTITVDERTGQRTVAGLADLGGMAIKGTVRLTGQPFRHVRVSLPTSVRLVAPDGSSAEAIDLRTNLSPDPALDANGELRFHFGGRLVVSGGNSGEFRGRIPITADYQ